MSQTRSAAWHRSVAAGAVTLTALACAGTLLLRTPLCSRYWAWCIQRAASESERAAYLAALCNAGPSGRWGVAALLDSPQAQFRQYGVLALYHLRTPWARQRLRDALRDREPSVQRLAAVGLAVHGDESVIPTLKSLYEAGDADAASAACLALERLATAAAMAALTELALEPADVSGRAALVDALAGIGKAECVPALLALLTDHRVCPAPAAPEAEGLSRGTIAERAADALARITGIPAPFSSAASPSEQAAAQRRWSDWWSARQLHR